MGKLERLDIDVSLDSCFGKQESNLIDVYNKKEDSLAAHKKDDEIVSFSSDLVKCFKSKIKESSAKLRVDSLIETYKGAEETYSEESKCSLSAWCMANVNRFLNVAEGKNFNVSEVEPYIVKAEQELKELNLNLNFQTVDDLYIETRKESIRNTMESRLERQF